MTRPEKLSARQAIGSKKTNSIILDISPERILVPLQLFKIMATNTLFIGPGRCGDNQR